MNVQEFDTALSELETRVDRLRALYENWFRGYEKMEPSVARKDVERRVYGLRKELPRNTALRFRYHQLYQRYTSLATYWQRTARQIEEGTYRLQLQRMKRRRVDDDLLRTNPPPARGETDTPTPPSYELNIDETLDVHRLLEEVDIDQVARAIDVPGPFSARPPVLPTMPSTSLAPRAPQPALATPPTPAIPPVPPQVTSARFSRPSVANDVVSAKGAPFPSRAAPPAQPTSLVPPQVLAAAPTAPATGVHAGVPKPPPLKIPLPGAPSTGTIPGLPMPRMTVRPSPSAAGNGQPAPPPLRAATPAAPGAGRAPIPSAPAPTASVPGSRPAPVAPRSEPAAGLSDQRLRRLYDEYAAARRKNNESDIRFETLAGTIQKMLPDLSKKHQGKQIDFEVVLKDGRVGLRPKAT